jgi:transcriptional regulator with XRE-family HTH domain
MTPANAGTQIKQAREARGWTQQDLSHRAHISLKTIWAAENGESVRRNTIRRLAEVLNLDSEDLLAQEVAS